MILIVCVDDGLGMAFNGRRQSRDEAVCRDMVTLAAGRPIRMEERSAKLFEGLGGSVLAGPDFMEDAGPGELCFVELRPAGDLALRAGQLVLYRWNRHYPADLRFDVPLQGWRLAETVEFPGSSHEKITREVYVREA